MLRRLHRWVGLAISLLVLIMALTGTLLVWSPEYISATVPEARMAVQPDLATLGSAVETILASYPPNTVRFIDLNPHALGVHKVALIESRHAWHAQDGSLVQSWSRNERLEDWLLDLHHRFLLGNTLGLTMAGLSGFLLVLLVIAGVFLWWPTRHAIAFGLWPAGPRPDQFLRAHRNMGVLASLPILLLAITGVILVYPTESAGILLGDPARQRHRVVSLDNVIGGPTVADKLETAVGLFPGSTARWVRPPGQNHQKFIVGVQQAHSWNRLGRSYVIFSGDIAEQKLDAMVQTNDKRLFDFILPLHTGMLPLWYRLCLTVLGLLLVLVSSFGVGSWWQKLKQHNR